MAYELLNQTFGQKLDEITELYPLQEALVAPEKNIRWDYREFRDRVNKVAKGLYALGIGKGDHVAIWATNYPEWILTMFATARIGAVMVTVNTNYRNFELSYLLKQSDSMTLIMSKGTKEVDYVEMINKLCPTLEFSAPGELESEDFPCLRNIIYLEDEKVDGMFNFSQLYEFAEYVSDFELKLAEQRTTLHDVVNMQYTSGTTGFPKGVMLTHHNVLNNGKSIGDCMKFTEKDRLCITVPLFHCFGCVLGVTAAFSHGTTIVLIDHFNPLTVMQALQDEKCTAVHGVPTMFIAMLNHDRFQEFDFSHMRTGIMAGSPCPVEVMRQVVDKMNMREITIVFGQTEASPGCTQTTTDDPLEVRVKSVGRELPHVECKIVDPETNKELPRNTVGEFVARGYNIMKGYYNMPEATALAVDSEGWLHTGDLAMQDDDGYYHITGRIKDMIIRGGENIYPKELEELLYTHPQVKDVQVIGVPDERYGEVVMACIVPIDDAILTEEEVREFVKENVAKHKIPQYVEFVDAFPMTASGKIQKFKMREDAIKKLGLDKAAQIETA
ncbi:MAG: AMP-binding protein [Anaerofustis sp.]